jgi:dethiobiotin synthetase
MARPKENLATLQRLIPVPCLGVLPHGVDAVSSAACLRDAADLLSAPRR